MGHGPEALPRGASSAAARRPATSPPASAPTAAGIFRHVDTGHRSNGGTASIKPLLLLHPSSWPSSTALARASCRLRGGVCGGARTDGQREADAQRGPSVGISIVCAVNNRQPKT